VSQVRRSLALVSLKRYTIHATPVKQLYRSGGLVPAVEGTAVPIPEYFLFRELYESLRSGWSGLPVSRTRVRVAEKLYFSRDSRDTALRVGLARSDGSEHLGAHR
jgi:hypothetical protein